MVGVKDTTFKIDTTPCYFDVDKFKNEFYVAKSAYLGREATVHDVSSIVAKNCLFNEKIYKLPPSKVNSKENTQIIKSSFEAENKSITLLKQHIDITLQNMQNVSKDSASYQFYEKYLEICKSDIFAITFAMAEARLNKERFEKKFPPARKPLTPFTMNLQKS